MSAEDIHERLSGLLKNISEIQQEIISIKICEKKILEEIEYLKIHLVKKEKKQSSKKKAASELKTKPMSADEIDIYKKQFLELFEKWMSGEPLQVKNILDTYDVQALRSFADANNLNVTSKMPKQRILHLIDARFREKKMLMK